MNRLFVFLLGVLFFSDLFAQNNREDSFSRAQDSLRTVMEQRFTAYQKQRRIYERMFAEDPKKAIDSVVRTENTAHLETGRKRLHQYRSNTRPDTLKEINLKYAGLDQIPDFVYEAKNIEILILDNNYIKKLPKKLAQLKKLKRIYWRENNLEDFWWIRIQKIEGLEKLDLSNNTLTRLPIGIRKLTGLKQLVLDKNLFDEVPVSRLKRADFVQGVSFNKIPSLKINENDYEKLDFIKIFKANNCGIDAIDPSFYHLAGLVELQLQENRLKELPDGISRLSNLKKLSFYKNELSSLPNDFFDLNLTIVDLYYNQLEVIPEEIHRLKELEILFLAHNKIYSLPESIGHLTNLDQVYLHHNRLSVLPESIASLSKLKVARVNDNYLIEFPDQFIGMKYLKDLDISNNQISTIPRAVGDLSSLELFTYQNNPIDFNDKENAHLAAMIVKMMEAGTTCVPRVYKEEIVETSQVSEAGQ